MRCLVNVGRNDGHGGAGCGQAIKGLLLCGGGDTVAAGQAELARAVGDELLRDL